MHKVPKVQKVNQALTKQITQLEYKIMRAEKEQEKINALFYAHTYGTSEYNKAVVKLQDNKKLLDDLYAQWKTLMRESKFLE
jgi:hypothetical protein